MAEPTHLLAPAVGDERTTDEMTTDALTTDEMTTNTMTANASARPTADAATPVQVAAGRVVIVSGSVGAGHDGVARQLATRLRARGHTVEVLDLLEGFPRWAAMTLGSVYLLVLRHAPLLYESACWLVERSRIFQRLADVVCCSSLPWLRPRVADADLVVATYPPASRALGRLRDRGELTVPAVTYLTDPAPNYLWVHPSIDRHLTMSRATAEEAQRRYGVPMHPAGPLTDPVWRATHRLDARRHLRTAIGVSKDTPVGVLLLGSLGMGDVRPAARALRAAGVHPVVLCGRNTALVSRLATEPGTTALGWRTDTAELVAGADVVVHNAGGLSLTESLVAGIPSLTFRPIPGHGRANARTLHDSGLVPWAHSAEDLTQLARAALGTSSLPWPLHEETAVDQICAMLS